MSDKGVIFDMDGVLVDSYEAHYESWKLLGQAHGLTMTRDEFSATFGQTSRDIIRNLWGDAATDEEIPEWDAEKEALYREIIRRDFPEMKGASTLLASLDDAGFALAVGSSGPPENVQAVIDCLPNADRFTARVTGMDVTRGKPDPQVFLLAAGKLGLAPEQCIVVEDAVPGVLAGKAAGMPVVAITGTASRDTLAQHADLVVDCLTELTPDAFDALLR